MVMDVEREENGGGGGGGGGGEEIELNETSPQEGIGLVQDMLGVIESVGRLGDYRRTHRKECCRIVRRMKLLLPFLEEVRDFDGTISELGVDFLIRLKKVFHLAQKLLETCHDGSKIILAVESEAFMVRFHTIDRKLWKVLVNVPFDGLGISAEVKEQVELMQVQLRRAKRRADTQDIELAVDMMVVLSKTDDRNADSAILERLAQKLDLRTVEDLKAETAAVRKIAKERWSHNIEATEQIVDLLNKFKQILGMEVTEPDGGDHNHPVLPKPLERNPALVIPHEFLCPIALEIMTDPVIIGSGQTYERESIQKWFDSNHRTCPKTRQTLVHLSVAPNYALKNLIMQWCAEKNFQLPQKKNVTTSCPESSSPEDIEKISALIRDLSSTQLDVQRRTVKKIRLLSKENPENRILVAKNGGIPPLIHLLSYPDSKILEHAVTALLNLSLDENNKMLIAREGAIPAIIEVLKSGKTEARENAAAALFSLSMVDENKITVGLCNGIPPLVEMLQNGTVRGKKDAATALFNLSLNSSNKGRAIEAGIVTPLLNLLKDKNLGMVDEALCIFLLLASHPEGRIEIGQLSFIETLVEFIQEGTPKNKECATSVLLELGSCNSSFILAALQFGVYEHLVEITRSGTSRAQRKAAALLQLMTKSEQI